MELDIHIARRPIDLGSVEDRLFEIDPAATVDLDPATGHLRVSTFARPEDVAAALAVAGYPVAAADIAIVPSICCGGCSG